LGKVPVPEGFEGAFLERGIDFFRVFDVDVEVLNCFDSTLLGSRHSH
jgi:hypothetical protein